MGIVTIGDLHDVAWEQRGGVTVAEVMGGRDGVVTTTPGSTLLDAAQTLASHDFDELPVVENGRILGLLTRADIIRVLQVRAAKCAQPRAR